MVLLKLVFSLLITYMLVGELKCQLNIPQTPCKSVFNYKTRNGTNDIYGYIKFRNDYSGDYQLEIRMSVARKIHRNIAILRLQSEEEIQCGSPIEYEVSFPPCDSLIPSLTFLKYNEKMYCTGPPEKDIYGTGTTKLVEYDGLVTDMHEEGICQTPSTPREVISSTPSQFTIPKLQEQRGGCGIIQEINGREHFPWLATLYQHSSYRCSATLISNSHRNYHRLAEVANMTIQLGRNNIKEITPSASSITRKIKNVHIHPSFVLEDFKHRMNNIAIFELDEPVEYSDLIRSACLWSGSDNLTEVVDKQAIVVGWGDDAKPKKFSMPIISHADCIRSNVAQFSVLLEETSFCAGNRYGVVPCTGNSGGSLMLLGEYGRYYLRGMTSGGIIRKNGVSCDGYSYNLFTDVAKFTNWISRHIHT